MNESDLALAQRLGAIADDLSMGRFRAHDLRVETKGDLSPVTEADLAIEHALRDEIARTRPSDHIVGEEMGGPESGGRRWIIDPIDGTKTYARGGEAWATLIALEVDARVEVAVVSMPAMGHRYHAVRGAGAFCDDQPIRVSAVDQLERAVLAHTSLSGFVWSHLDDRLRQLADRCWDARGFGNSLSHVSVARGTADIAWTSRANPWDFAALSLLVEEAGGSFHDGALATGSGMGISSNRLLHEAALAAAGVPTDGPRASTD